jgi:hypothetical protein
MGYLVLIPFFIQIVAIGLDETIYHLKRDLPKWERIGHPLDTLSVIACILFVLLIPYRPELIKYYIGLAVFSCLLITKDEFVHKHHCPAGEHWLHALLFVNHSLLLSLMGLMWPKLTMPELSSWLPSVEIVTPFLWIQAILASIFCLYQIIYWNFIAKVVDF